SSASLPDAVSTREASTRVERQGWHSPSDRLLLALSDGGEVIPGAVRSDRSEFQRFPRRSLHRQPRRRLEGRGRRACRRVFHAGHVNAARQPWGYRSLSATRQMGETPYQSKSKSFDCPTSRSIAERHAVSVSKYATGVATIP